MLLTLEKQYFENMEEKIDHYYVMWSQQKFIYFHLCPQKKLSRQIQTVVITISRVNEAELFELNLCDNVSLNRLVKLFYVVSLGVSENPNTNKDKFVVNSSL